MVKRWIIRAGITAIAKREHLLRLRNGKPLRFSEFFQNRTMPGVFLLMALSALTVAIYMEAAVVHIFATSLSTQNGKSSSGALSPAPPADGLEPVQYQSRSPEGEL